MDFEMRTRSFEDETSVVEIRGEIDVHSCRASRDEFRDLLGSGARRYVLDLAELTFIDSAGLGMLVNFSRRVGERGGRLVLMGASPTVRKVFRMTGLDRLFSFAADEREAREILSRPAEDGGPEDSVLAGPGTL